MRIVAGAVVAVWIIALLLALLLREVFGSLGASGVAEFTTLLALANMLMFSSDIVVAAMARDERRDPLPQSRSRNALSLALGVLFFLGALSTFGIFGNTRELGSLMVNVTAHPVAILLFVQQVERLHRREIRMCERRVRADAVLAKPAIEASGDALRARFGVYKERKIL